MANLADLRPMRYNAYQKHESTLLHMYVMNEILTADYSFTTTYFRKKLV